MIIGVEVARKVWKIAARQSLPRGIENADQGETDEANCVSRVIFHDLRKTLSRITAVH